MCAGNYRGADRLETMILYAMAYARQQEKALAYKNYIVDSLYCMQHNLAVRDRFRDWVSCGAAKEETGEQIMARMMKKLGGEPVESI